jgi:hypothetical protein
VSSDFTHWIARKKIDGTFVSFCRNLSGIVSRAWRHAGSGPRQGLNCIVFENEAAVFQLQSRKHGDPVAVAEGRIPVSSAAVAEAAESAQFA